MSDNELDAELLGMVGGESDDEGDDVPQTQTYEERSPSQEATQSVEKIEEPAVRTKGVAQKVKGRKKRARKQESEEEDDLGSPSPVSSPEAATMPAPDDDADASGSPVQEDAPLYPYEGKYLSAADKAEIMAMTEVQREEVLAERAAFELKRQQDLQLKKALAATKFKASAYKKRSAAAAELEDEGRRTRPKAEKTKTALDDYRRARELKGTERGRLEAGRKRKDESRSPSVGSDRDAEGEEEDVEFAEPSEYRRRDEAAPDMRDFERCRMGRTAFAKICFWPGFEATAKGCYARVSIGVNRETGQNIYRMTQIKGFAEGKPYQLQAPNGKQFSTNVYAIVTQGLDEKPWPFSACSDSSFTDQEYDRYISKLEKDNIRRPTKRQLIAKLDAIHSLLNMTWTDERISQKLANQRAMERKLDPANIAKAKREKIMQRKLKAEEEEDADEIMRCDAELAALENAAQSSSINGHSNGIKSSPAAKTNSLVVHQQRMAQLNNKNRGKNAEEVRNALLEEKRKLQLAREKAAREAKEKAEAEAEKKRQEAAAKLLTVPRTDMTDLFGEGSDISRAGTPGPAGTPRRSRSGTPMTGVKEKRLGGPIGMIKKKNMDDDVIASLDLGIDIEI